MVAFACLFVYIDYFKTKFAYIIINPFLYADVLYEQTDGWYFKLLFGITIT